MTIELANQKHATATFAITIRDRAGEPVSLSDEDTFKLTIDSNELPGPLHAEFDPVDSVYFATFALPLGLEGFHVAQIAYGTQAVVYSRTLETRFSKSTWTISCPGPDYPPEAPAVSFSAVVVLLLLVAARSLVAVGAYFALYRRRLLVRRKNEVK